VEHPSTESMGRLRIELIRQAQENQLRKLKNTMSFKKMLPRDKCQSSQAKLDSHEKRFETVKGDFEMLSKFRDTKGATSLDTGISRPELWPTKEHMPDYEPSLPESHLSSFDISKMSGHDVFKNVRKTFQVPD
jgi:hypothetical protein